MTMPGAAVKRPAIPLRATVILVATLGGIYVVSQFFRNSIGVIAPDLARELTMSAAEIGVLSSAFFFSFAAAQIPLGIGLDRYGPKICMLVCAGIVAAGAVLFSVGTSPGMLIAARVLMGVGCCCYLMAPLALYAKRYSPEKFGTLVGVQLGVGTLGTLFATAPLAWSVASIGWRASFLAVAGLTVFAGVMVSIVVREDKTTEAHGVHHETLRESIAGLAQAFRVRSMGQLFFCHLAAYSSFVLVVGLWGGPYLTHIYGFSLTERGDMLFAAVMGQIVAVFLFGPTDRIFRGYKIPVLTGALLTVLTLGVVAFVGVLPAGWILPWFIAIGAVTAYTPVMIAHGKSLFPPHLVGRGMTIFNMATMGGAFLSQTVTGFVINQFPIENGAYALDAYRAVFGLQALFVLAACIPYLFAHDPWRKA
ncbi:MAG TPA: MFS transporter [Pseudorhodoplanes sp.]|nr:MFS transporter [Pseudorhodoplanes sp.]